MKYFLSIVLIILVISFLFIEYYDYQKVDYKKTSSVSYSNQRKIKLLEVFQSGTQYLNYIVIKVSINKPIDSPLEQIDSVYLKSFADSIVFKYWYQKNTNVEFTVFYETDYTNKIFAEKKGLLFTEFSPYLFSYSTIVNKKDDWCLFCKP